MARVIGHLDLDYFYAQVEEVEDPSLKEIPVVVCVYSGRTADSGVVSTANYRAREHGVRSAMPIALAKKKLEGVEARFIPLDHAKYERYSERVMETVRSNVDVMEQTGIDEAFFDITKRTSGDYNLASQTASKLKQAILEGEKLTCSIGLGPNKVVAKLASDFRKPNGLTVVPPESMMDFMGPLPVDKLYGAGPKTVKALQEVGVNTIGDLARSSPDRLESALGRKLAVYLYNAANGADDDPVAERGEATQISRIITLKHDSKDDALIMRELNPIIEDVQRKAMERGLAYRSISVIGVRKDLSIRTRSKTLEVPANDLGVLRKDVAELLNALVSAEGELRRVGVRISDFSQSLAQTSLAEFLG